MKKKLPKLIIFALILVGLGVALHENIIKLPITKKIEAQYIAGLDDDRKMVGISDNVFIGRVIKKGRNKIVDNTPSTEFQVEVLYNIKGELRGEFTVSQEGGYENGILYVLNAGDVIHPDDGSDDWFLNTDDLYLFYTSYDPKDQTHWAIFHPNATKKLKWEKNLTDDAIKSEAQQDQRIKELEEAYKNEILNETDVENNYTRNTYKEIQENIEKR